MSHKFPDLNRVVSATPDQHALSDQQLGLLDITPESLHRSPSPTTGIPLATCTALAATRSA